VRRVPDEKFADVGLELCSEIVAEIATIEGTAEVHLMAFSWEEAIPEVLARAGIAPRGQRRIGGTRP
jgi:5,10-methylenetetrahydrofolate reductase